MEWVPGMALADAGITAGAGTYTADAEGLHGQSASSYTRFDFPAASMEEGMIEVECAVATSTDNGVRLIIATDATSKSGAQLFWRGGNGLYYDNGGTQQKITGVTGTTGRVKLGLERKGGKNTLYVNGNKVHESATKSSYYVAANRVFFQNISSWNVYAMRMKQY